LHLLAIIASSGGRKLEVGDWKRGVARNPMHAYRGRELGDAHACMKAGP